MCFVMEIIWYIVLIYQIKNLKTMDLLIRTAENKSHYVYIKGFNRFMCNKTKNKNKKHFCKYCLQCFSSESVLIEHKTDCLKINAKKV